jgi:peptide chain release factor 2
MLLRMYVRWGEKQRYKTRVVEKSPGEEAGIKSATVELEGRYVYGYLSGEKGTHRIVRQSPFNAKGLRQVIFSFHSSSSVNLSTHFHELKGVRLPFLSNS